MLQRDFGVRIYKSLLSLPEKEDKKEKEKKSKKDERKDKKEDRDEETDEPKPKRRKSGDDKDKKEDRDERKVCNYFPTSNLFQSFPKYNKWWWIPPEKQNVKGKLKDFSVLLET